jgi:hypothetical protein
VLPARTRPKKNVLLSLLLQMEKHAAIVSMGRAKPIELHGKAEPRARNFGTEIQ